MIKGADKDSTVIVWDRDDYNKQSEEVPYVHDENSNDPVPHCKTINALLAKTRKRGDSKRVTVYLMVKDPNFARFNLIPKIHEKLHNIPCRPVIANSSYLTENICFCFRIIISDTNDILKKLHSLPKLPECTIFCTMDVVGYMPHDAKKNLRPVWLNG